MEVLVKFWKYSIRIRSMDPNSGYGLRIQAWFALADVCALLVLLCCYVLYIMYKHFTELLLLLLSLVHQHKACNGASFADHGVLELRRPHFPFEEPWTGVGTRMLFPWCPLWWWWHACQSPVVSFLWPYQAEHMNNSYLILSILFAWAAAPDCSLVTWDSA